MKNLPIIIALFLNICLSAQESVSNRFQEAENTENTAAEAPENPHEAVLKEGDGPGNPPAEPIDDYIPVLLLVAMGIIAYQGYKKKTLS